MEKTTPARCRSHPEAGAGWSCNNCQAPLCPDCVAVRRSMSTEYLSCGLCQGQAVPILVHRSRIPLATQLRGAWRYPFTPTGLAVLAGLSFLLTVCRWAAASTFLLLKFMPTVIGLGIFWGAFFHIVRATARGERELDTPDYSEVFTDCVSPAMRGLVGTTLLWLPGLLYLLFIKGWDVSKPMDEMLSNPAFYVSGGLPQLDWSQVVGDPILWLIVLAGALYLPMALLFAAAGQSVLRMLNPVAVLFAARRLGRDYLITLGALAVLTVALVLGHVVAAGIHALELPLLSRLGAEFVTCLAPFLMAHVLGLLLYNRGDEIGYGSPTDYLEPVLGDARPRVAAPSLRPASIAPAEPPPEASASLTETLAALTQAVGAQDASKALTLYADISEPRSLKQIEPAHHLFVGQAAVAQGQYPLAIKALETAADVAPDGPEASRALVLLARVFAERMKEPERAASIYRYVVHRYPNTDASRFAQRHLSPTS
ncbi:tetratricopeptide repeat protein [Hyalangium versicolor]|uniref:tetratricopeptide repeat protein n=1 Tax=Hyalangium versicolor TaxID=2861190 RepID=UPI001CCE72A6|nr:tetratricopeptide repeat protein [Hyalangium versicolor]